MVASDQVAVPAQDGCRGVPAAGFCVVRRGESVEQGCEERPVGGGEPDLLAVQLPLQDHDLVAQGQDLCVLGRVTHRKQPQHRQRVGHAGVRQS